MKKGNKAQVAMEYIMIIGFVVAITIPLIIISYEQTQGAKDAVIATQAYNVAKKIADSAETVYYLGEPSKTTLKVYMPERVELTRVGFNEIMIRIETAVGSDDVVAYSTVPVNGTLPITSGVHYIEIDSRGDYVWVST